MMVLNLDGFMSLEIKYVFTLLPPPSLSPSRAHDIENNINNY